MSLGKKVKELREAKAWTQGQLATYAKLGHSGRQYISLLEIEKIEKPSAEKVLRLAQALEVHEDVLYQAAGLRAEIRPNAELDELMLYLHGQHPTPKVVRQIREIAETLLRAND